MKSTYSRLVGIGYFAAAVLVLFPVIDLVANLWPIEPGRVNWRYGAYMLLSGFVLTMLLGMVLALLVGRAGRHARTLRVLAVLNAFAGAALLAAAAVFVLDALQLQTSVTGDARRQFGIGVVKSLVKNTTVASGFLWIAWIGWRRDRATVRNPRDGDPDTLVATSS